MVSFDDRALFSRSPTRLVGLGLAPFFEAPEVACRASRPLHAFDGRAPALPGYSCLMVSVPDRDLFWPRPTRLVGLGLAPFFEAPEVACRASRPLHAFD